jgi:hypothetical protein
MGQIVEATSLRGDADEKQLPSHGVGPSYGGERAVLPCVRL